MASLTNEEIEEIKAQLEAQRVEDPDNVCEPHGFTGYGEVDNG